MELFKKCTTCDGDGTVIFYEDCGCCANTRECDACDGVGFYKIDWDLSKREIQEILAFAYSHAQKHFDHGDSPLYHLREAHSFLF